jgi:hypothetical protein
MKDPKLKLVDKRPPSVDTKGSAETHFVVDACRLGPTVKYSRSLSVWILCITVSSELGDESIEYVNGTSFNLTLEPNIFPKASTAYPRRLCVQDPASFTPFFCLSVSSDGPAMNIVLLKSSSSQGIVRRPRALCRHIASTPSMVRGSTMVNRCKPGDAGTVVAEDRKIKIDRLSRKKTEIILTKTLAEVFCAVPYQYRLKLKRVLLQPPHHCIHI